MTRFAKFFHERMVENMLEETLTDSEMTAVIVFALLHGARAAMILAKDGHIDTGDLRRCALESCPLVPVEKVEELLSSALDALVDTRILAYSVSCGHFRITQPGSIMLQLCQDISKGAGKVGIMSFIHSNQYHREVEQERAAEKAQQDQRIQSAIVDLFGATVIESEDE